MTEKFIKGKHINKIMSNQQEWKKAISSYAISIDNYILVATEGFDQFEGAAAFCLELNDSEGPWVAYASNFIKKNGIEEFEESKGKELLKYKGLVVEAEGLPDQTKKGLLKLLEKIEGI